MMLVTTQASAVHLSGSDLGCVCAALVSVDVQTGMLQFLIVTGFFGGGFRDPRKIGLSFFFLAFWGV